MQVGDCSQWHHLIFCEELQNNGEENHVLCIVCRKSVLGCPAYKCLECDFLQHKSCIEPTHAIEMQVDHDLQERHHMMFIEEVDDNSGNEKVVCSGCEEALFGPAYKCSMPKCTFLLHNSCTKLSHVIQHPMHREHTLFLRLPSQDNGCDVCRQDCNRSFFYRCYLCDFDIHIKCAPLWRINADDCHQHALLPTRKQIQFTCEACAEESKGFAYLCSLCGVFTHPKCAQFPHTIKTKTHDHSLTRTYSLRPVKKEGIVFCKLCYRKVNTEFAAYSCKKCGYVAHLDCAYRLEDKSSTSTIESVASNSIGYESHLVHLVEGINLKEGERAGPQEIKHFSHPQHSLILNNEKLMDDMRCEACMQFIISPPFYGCSQCNFFVHNRCAKLTPTIKRGLFHEHSLTLLSQEPSMGGMFWCYTCQRFRHGFRYNCDTCGDYTFDIQCCLIPETLKHESHQHIIFLSMSCSDETCIACDRRTSIKFVCTFCNEFALCIRCATLPLVVRYAYDTHPLKLSYTREDEFGEYYCLICEGKRDHPDHWFYYCIECDFSSHVQCVLGENPYIIYGRTFTYENHKHPLTIVQKTKHSPPCDVCGMHFYNSVALECTQCKFNVHWDCLSGISKKKGVK